MNTAVLIMVFIFFVFILITPILGIISLFKDVSDSRKRGTEIDESKKIAASLVKHLQLLRKNDIAEFKASLSNWLENFITVNNSGWVRMNLRFMLEAQAITLGETTRDKLQYHEGFRRKIIKRTLDLSRAMDVGMVEAVMEKTGDLIATVLSSYTPTVSSNDMIDSRELTAKTLKHCSQLITKDIVAAENEINAAFRRVAEAGNVDKMGVPLLVLKWAQISIKDISGRSFRKSITFTNALKEVSSEFSQVSNFLRKNQIQELARLIYEY